MIQPADEILKAAVRSHGTLTAWRHEFHRIPELAYKEHKTAARVSAILREIGIDEIHEGIGGTGVVGVIRNGDGGCVALRADMDALPIAETAPLPYRSSHDGVMHACGHDGHMAMLLGAARYLAATRRFTGSIVLVFQPAEEGAAGARAMMDDGLLARFDFSAIHALHNMPGLPAGELAVGPGPVMAHIDTLSIAIHGRGGHAGMPHQARDAIVAVSNLVTALQSIVSRNVDPVSSAVITIGRIEGGSANNAVAETAAIHGTVRYLEPELGGVLKSRIEAVAHGIAAAHHVAASVTYSTGRPATVNSAVEAACARQAASELSPLLTVAARQTPILAAEDFGLFLKVRPGSMAFLGAGERVPQLHSPLFDFNDEILPAGMAYLARVAERTLLDGQTP